MIDIIRITLALPKDLWEQVKQAAPEGKRTEFIIQAIRTALEQAGEQVDV